MQQPVEHELCDEDLQRIRDNELGAPLHIYKQKPGLVRLFRVLTAVLTLLLIVALALSMFVQLKHWSLSHTLPQEARPDTFLDDLGGSLAMMIPGLVMLLLLRSEVKRICTARIIVCEHGLLLVEQRFRKWHIEVVPWEDIQAITPIEGLGFFPPDYSLMHRGGKAISINGYQDVEALISQIQPYSEEYLSL